MDVFPVRMLAFTDVSFLGNELFFQSSVTHSCVKVVL